MLSNFDLTWSKSLLFSWALGGKGVSSYSFPFATVNDK